MISKILQYLLSYFKTTSKKESALEQRIEDGEKKLEEIEESDYSDDDMVDHFNE